jgi:HSP20 family protein
MTLIRRTSPFGEFLSLRNAMDRLMDDAFLRPANGSDEARGMPLDIYTTDDALVVEAALPGVKPENVEISVLGDTLTLTASSDEKRTAEEGGYHVQEVRRGRFSRTVTLPSSVKADAASATFENGLLRLSIPKAEQARPRQIPISGLTEGTATAVTAGDQAPAQEQARGQQDG